MMVPDISGNDPVPERPSTTDDAGTPASRERGDGYVIGLALAGVILGGAVGFFISFSTVGLFITILCTAGGVIGGGVGGALVGEALKKRMMGRDTHEDDE
jgi:hypothetical protein